MSRALINGVAAFENGINWIDSTVTGMGRGWQYSNRICFNAIFKNLSKNSDISLLLKLIEKICPNEK